MIFNMYDNFNSLDVFIMIFYFGGNIGYSMFSLSCNTSYYINLKFAAKVLENSKEPSRLTNVVPD